MPKVLQNLPAGQVGVKRKLARQVAEQPLNLYRLLPDIQPGDARRARVGTQQRHQQANRRCFARAVGTKEAKDFALFHLEGYVKNAALAAIALGQAVYFDNCCHVIVLLQNSESRIHHSWKSETCLQAGLMHVQSWLVSAELICD